MLRETAEIVDRGRYPTAVTPWEQETWREEALAWTRRELTTQGIGMHGTGQRKVRLRPWSVLVRIPVEGSDAVWFKANPPASAFEARLTEALARWVPEHVLKPLAVDADRGWALLPDGGALFRDVLDSTRGQVDPHAWEEPLRRYAAMQRTLTAYTDRIETLGVPGARTTALPEIFDRTVEENAALEPSEIKALRELRPRLAGWCEELAGAGIDDTLDHADLHDGQLFVSEPGRFTFFDWGDALVSHPFCSFLVPARAARERFGPEVLPRLRDAYLEPWEGNGVTQAELRRAVGLAWRLGAVGRARSFGRLFPGTSGGVDGACDADSARWLLELLTEPPTQLL
ncbi:aminoglycoside phosphotransferase family protein [Streptomyces sp. NPDC052052]|uniref:aminoglycoside phosphotransferase family protein n=1 Tax=Streptomyces sp. NPDC052052 TaxID=3154756 RepID=UPI00343B76BB